MKSKIALICTLALLLGTAALALLPVHGESNIYTSVVRLHVLANSDSESDQSDKLQVRDAVLAYTEPLLETAQNVEEAEELLQAHLSDIQKVAEKTLQNIGTGFPVIVTLQEEEYPKRTYDALCFPGGTYLSLRILIGEAAGKNWWCCLFPPLCKGAAAVPKEEAEEALVSVGLTPSQYRIITETEKPVYKVRFKILELFQKQ